MAGQNESTSSIPPMDLTTLYAGGDWEYMSDERSTQNTDDEAATADNDNDDGLPPPVNETKRKKAKEEAEAEDEPEADADADTDTTEDDDNGEEDDPTGESDDEDGAKAKGAKGKDSTDDGEGTGDEADNEARVGSVPKWRLDQQTKKLRQTEREMAALQEQLAKLTGKQPDSTNQDPAQPQQPQQTAQDDQYKNQLKELQTKRNELRDQYEEAIIDGDSKKTKALREQLDTVEDDMFEVRVNARTQQVQEESVSRSAVERELETVANEVQADYSPLNPDHESYDEDLVGEVVAYRNMLITQMGRKPGEALREAAETMAKKYDIPSERKADPKQDKTKGKESKTEQRSKGKEKAAKQQPPKMPGKRNEPKVSDIASMTDQEFDKLTPEQRAELRGDYRVQ